MKAIENKENNLRKLTFSVEETAQQLGVCHQDRLSADAPGRLSHHQDRAAHPCFLRRPAGMGSQTGAEQNGGHRMNCKKCLVLTGFEARLFTEAAIPPVDSIIRRRNV